MEISKESPQNVEKMARSPGGEKSVNSSHVSGCHGFFGPDVVAIRVDRGLVRATKKGQDTSGKSNGGFSEGGFLQ